MVLMPRVEGVDWASLADDIRDGSLQLNREQRFTLCRNLAELVRLLEDAGCAHRDISSGNTFICTSTWLVILIDFDSIYHPSLRMPAATTCGTEGYTAAFVWRRGAPWPEATWCEHDDRFQLAMVSVEFLALDRGAPLGAEGGMFDQAQLRARDGATLRRARDRLRSEYPDALPIFDSAINSRDCSDCPAPADWIRLCDGVLGPVVEPPPLHSLEDVTPADFAHILANRIPAAPVWPAPRLDELPLEPLGPPPVPQPSILLPEDPWGAGQHTRKPGFSATGLSLDSLEEPS